MIYVHIVMDSEPTRILGAWIGNKVEQNGIWSCTMDKIEGNLQQWAKSHPTIEGRRLIVQMVVAGMTQFLTKVQGMPQDIEKGLTKRIRKFMWNSEGSPPLSSQALEQPLTQGGKKLLDLNARNKAIQLTWLKSYTRFDSQRPQWASFADELIKKHTIDKYKKVEHDIKVNIFLQSWKVNARMLPADLREMLKLAKGFHVKMELLQASPALKDEMPIWLHAGADGLMQLMYNSKEAKCLRDNHKLKTVGNVRKLAMKRALLHRPKRSCKCLRCRELRRIAGCNNPHKCHKMAQTILNTLLPKWNPTFLSPKDGLDLTPRRKQRNAVAEAANKPIIFDPKVTQLTIPDAVRIFTDPEQHNNMPARRVSPLQNQAPQQVVVVYTDGSCLNNGEENAQAGSGIWFGRGDPRNRALRLPGQLQSNQRGGMYAIPYVVRPTPSHCPRFL